MTAQNTEKRAKERGVAKPYPPMENLFLRTILWHYDANKAQRSLQSFKRTDAIRRGYSNLLYNRQNQIDYNPQLEQRILELGEELALKQIVDMYGYLEEIGEELTEFQKELRSHIKASGILERHEQRLQDTQEQPKAKRGRPRINPIITPN